MKAWCNMREPIEKLQLAEDLWDDLAALSWEEVKRMVRSRYGR